MSTWGDIIADALRDIGVYQPQSVLLPIDTPQGVRRLNRILDMYSARWAFAWSTVFGLFTLTPGHAPTLIGPNLTAPDFGMTPRPVRLESCNLVLTDQTPAVDVPMNIRDNKWWEEERVKLLQSNVPTDVFYQPLFPSGVLNFWPVPNYAYQVRLETWASVSTVPLNSSGLPNLAATFSMAPGYEMLVQKSLAVYSCVPYGKPVTPELREELREAKATVQKNNAKSPRTASADYGTRGKPPSGFNYYDGQPA